MKKRPLLEVTWDDAFNNSRWFTQEDAEGWHDSPLRCVTIGWLVKKDKTGITLAHTVVGSPNVASDIGSPWHIPTGMIRKVRRIRG